MELVVMRVYSHKLAILLGMFVTVPAAAASMPAGTGMQASPAQAAAATGVFKPSLCFAYLFYRAMPGKTNYCLGLKDWDNGYYDSGLELLKLSAGWGNKNAQYTLGLIYYNGHHVGVDHALGIAWMTLADERHNDPQIAKVLRSLVNWATLVERQRAAQLVQQMRGKYGDKVAALRAWRHLQHWKTGDGLPYSSHDAFGIGCIPISGAQAFALRHAAALRGLPSVSTTQQVGGTVHAWHASCVPVPMQRHMVQRSADTYFSGWMGTVSVGPLKTVPAPGTSSGH